MGSIPTPGSTYVAPSRQTVAGFLELWIDGARSELAITAWTNYRETIRRYIVPYVDAKRLVDLSPLDIKVMHAGLLYHGRGDGTALAVASVQLAHRVLHRALADAVRWNLIPTNPATGARIPKGERKEMSVWTTEEAGTFLSTVADDRLAALWTVALHTGLRRGELAGLRWKDVDLDAQTLTVAQQRTNAGNQVVVMAPSWPASSTHIRHRLNPDGNRQLNHALHVAALGQISHNTPGRDYYLRKQAEGHSRKEAMRSLKRQLSDAVHRQLDADAHR